MSAGELRLGVVGAGWIVEKHLASLDVLGGARVAAVADLDGDRAAVVAERTGATAHRDWRAMLDGEALDAVLVCTPPRAHREPAVAALERGLPVYLEKPVARDLEDARAIRAAVAAQAGVCAVGYQYRAIDFLDALREALTGQALGLLASLSIGATAGRSWFVDQAEGGGQILERASHHIDLQRAIAGEVSAVQAAGSRVSLAGPDRPAESGIDDVVALTLHYASGAIGSVLVAWTHPDLPSEYQLDLSASEAALRVELDPAFAVTGVSRGRPLTLRATSRPVERSLGRFLEAARAGDPGLVACTVEDALGTLAVAIACEQAVAEGGLVPVGDG